MAARLLTSRQALVMFLFVVFAFLSNAYWIQTQQATQNAVIRQQDINTGRSLANTAKVAQLIADGCSARNDAAEGTNEVIEALSASVRNAGPHVYTQAQREARLIKYAGAKVELVACAPVPAR